MKNITQKEFNNLPSENGVKICPGHTDYANIASFGERASFGEGCMLEGDKELIGSTIYCAGGLGSKSRTTYGIPTKEGVFIRCGCWSGWLNEFRARIEKVYKDNPIQREYVLMASLFQARWEREVKK